jgi:hypothetical protein
MLAATMEEAYNSMVKHLEERERKTFSAPLVENAKAGCVAFVCLLLLVNNIFAIYFPKLETWYAFKCIKPHKPYIT